MDDDSILFNNIKQEIRDYFKEEKINLKNESEIFADFIINDHGEYTVKCALKERRETLLDIRINVPTKDMARSICDNWRTKSTDVYRFRSFQVLYTYREE